MPKLTFSRSDGTETTVRGEPGLSVMEVLRAGGSEEVLALCGGACSCGTCHVYVGSDFFDRLPPMSEDERNLLDCLDRRKSTSRLACQIPFSDELDGLSIVLVPES